MPSRTASSANTIETSSDSEKLRDTCVAPATGTTSMAATRMTPIICIAPTTTSAVSITMIRLYQATGSPETAAAVSSNVTYSSWLRVSATVPTMTLNRPSMMTAFSADTVERFPNRYWLMPTASPPALRLMRTVPSANPVERTIAIETSLYASVASEMSSMNSAASIATTTAVRS